MKRKRIFPTARPEPNNGKKLAQLVATRSPIDALKMLRAGQPIDVMLGWYVETGQAEADVFQMDRLDKLHKLEELKSRSEALKREITDAIQLHNLNNQQNEQNQASQAQTSTPSAAGTEGKNETIVK